MTPAEEITAAAQTLRDAAFRGAMTATPAVAALLRARHAIADWLDAEAARITATAHPTWHETIAPHALAVARLINAPAAEGSGQ